MTDVRHMAQRCADMSKLRSEQSTAEKIAHAEARAATWLAKANEQRERGRSAEASDAKSQYWLDRANKLRGYI